MCLKCVAEEMSQPALSELKQRIGFQDGKAGIWMGIDISGFNMPPLGNQIPRRLATQLYIYITYITCSFHTSMIVGGVM